MPPTASSGGISGSGIQLTSAHAAAGAINNNAVTGLFITSPLFFRGHGFEFCFCLSMSNEAEHSKTKTNQGEGCRLGNGY